MLVWFDYIWLDCPALCTECVINISAVVTIACELIASSNRRRCAVSGFSAHADILLPVLRADKRSMKADHSWQKYKYQITQGFVAKCSRWYTWYGPLLYCKCHLLPHQLVIYKLWRLSNALILRRINNI